MKRKIIPKQKFRTYAAFPLTTGDVRAYEVQLDLGQNVTGAEFKVVAVRADSKVIEDLGEVVDGVATYTLANSMYAVPGELTVRLQVLHNTSVLTDREIIFEVLEGTQNASQGSTVVPLNDSVILRLSALEDKIAGKVDKVPGKGLSENDFTNEYKQRLDSLDETIGGEVESIAQEIDSLSALATEHKNAVTNPHNVTAQQVGAYSKTEVDAKLGKKANREDLVNTYTYQGSVDTFEDLGISNVIELVPCGAPTLNGEVWGSFDENTGVLTVSPIPEDVEDDLIIPVKEVTLEKGYYIMSAGIGDESYSLGIMVDNFRHLADHCYTGTSYYVFKVEESTTITQAVYSRMGGGETIERSSYKAHELIKVHSKWVDESSYDAEYRRYSIPDSVNPYMQNGSVYNVLDTGMNYAWNGSGWDALGGEHRDLEARENIAELNTAVEDFILKYKGVGKKGAGYLSAIFNSDDNTADGFASFTAGVGNKNGGSRAFVCGAVNTVEEGAYATFTAGNNNHTTKTAGVTFGYGNKNHGANAFVAGHLNEVYARYCVALGHTIKILKDCGYGLGKLLTIDRLNQVVVGLCNKPDTKSVFIVGCGKYNSDGTIEQKNAITVRGSDGHTTIHQGLTVEGEVNGIVKEYKEDDGVSTSLRLTSPNGTVFKLTVDDDGTLKTTQV